MQLVKKSGCFQTRRKLCSKRWRKYQALPGHDHYFVQSSFGMRDCVCRAGFFYWYCRSFPYERSIKILKAGNTDTCIVFIGIRILSYKRFSGTPYICSDRAEYLGGDISFRSTDRNTNDNQEIPKP